MLCKLSIKNIKKSFKDYTIYFFTLILGVAIFYVFNAIESQTVLLETKESTYEIIKLMTQLLSAVSVFVSFILGFLIIYASRFLIKRRNKEFAIYMTLGMSKRKISMLLFFETIIIGLLSLGVGLIIGIFTSQLMSLVVANMFEVKMTKFTFTFSINALIKTIIYFGIMYLLVMLFNTVQISRCKLIDLITSAKRSEKVKIKNLGVAIFLFLSATAILSYCYYRVTSPSTGSIMTFEALSKIIALGSFSTFLLFYSSSGLLLRLVRKWKSLYYSELNSFTLRQISSKINTTIFSMTIICLMLFITICVLSSSISIKNSMTTNLEDLAPVDIQLEKRRNIPKDLQEEYGYTDEMLNSTYETLDTSLQQLGIKKDKYLKDQTTIHLYTDPSLTYGTSMGSQLDSIKQRYPFLNYDAKETIVKLSEYNQLAKQYHNKTYHLKENEYLLIGNYESMIPLRNEVLEKQEPLKILNKELKPKYKQVKDGFIRMNSNPSEKGIFVVPDSVIDNAKTPVLLEYEVLVANYKATNQKEKEKIEAIFTNKKEEKLQTNISGSTKIAIYEASIGIGALVTFIGLYLGIIFLISSAAILALKELSESVDNYQRFNILRKIGATNHQLNKALFCQIGLFFLFPLIVAIIHSIFGIKFCTSILEIFGQEDLLTSVGVTMLFLTIIYGGYFLITYYCSKNIIKEKRG